MSYNWKCCGFYPNNFGASALETYLKVIVPRSGYTCTSVGVRMYLGRSTHVPRSGYDDNVVHFREQEGSFQRTRGFIKWNKKVHLMEQKTPRVAYNNC